MPQIKLTVNLSPASLEIMCNIARQDGSHMKIAAFVDTGATTSLFPLHLLADLNLGIASQKQVELTQAGIGTLTVSAIQTEIDLSFEDRDGTLSAPHLTRVWFADTQVALIGFKDVLDRAALYVDMRKQTGWLELD